MRYKTLVTYVDAERFDSSQEPFPFDIFRVGDRFYLPKVGPIESGSWVVKTEDGEIIMFTDEGFHQTFIPADATQCEEGTIAL